MTSTVPPLGFGLVPVRMAEAAGEDPDFNPRDHPHAEPVPSSKAEATRFLECPERRPPIASRPTGFAEAPPSVLPAAALEMSPEVRELVEAARAALGAIDLIESVRLERALAPFPKEDSDAQG